MLVSKVPNVVIRVLANKTIEIIASAIFIFLNACKISSFYLIAFLRWIIAIVTLYVVYAAVAIAKISPVIEGLPTLKNIEITIPNEIVNGIKIAPLHK